MDGASESGRRLREQPDDGVQVQDAASAAADQAGAAVTHRE